MYKLIYKQGIKLAKMATKLRAKWVSV